MPSTTAPEAPSDVPVSRRDDRLDGFVGRARAAAEQLRAIDDHAAVDRIVRALAVAGVEHAVELARLVMEETHFGLFEDKVVKNYITTEFFYDHLNDKPSVEVIEEDAERAISYIAEPIGVVLALTPITNRRRRCCSRRSSPPRRATQGSSGPRLVPRAARSAPSRSSRGPASAPDCRATPCR
jgi:acyl-CoA reductase-like NAD-dependent aldehyde dehydrogenase